jgi:hypothetical protein
MRLFLPTAALTAAFFLISGTASASVVFDVNANLQYGGTLTGSFTTNNAFNGVTAYDIVASAGPGSPGFTFTGFTYGTGDSSVTAETSTLIQFDSTPGGEELRLTFSAPLSASGATLTTAGYESEITAGNRSITSGSVSPAVAGVPEPASFGLLTATLSAAAFIYKRRRGIQAKIR